MELRNCPQCGKLFTYISINLCPHCLREDEEDFRKVKEYLYENPGAGLIELAEATEVDESKIIRWIREGRLEDKKFTGLLIPCERCGTQISSGRYCASCAQELARGFSQGLTKPEKQEKKSGVKFHTGDMVEERSVYRKRNK